MLLVSQIWKVSSSSELTSFICGDTVEFLILFLYIIKQIGKLGLFEDVENNGVVLVLPVLSFR